MRKKCPCSNVWTGSVSKHQPKQHAFRFSGFEKNKTCTCTWSERIFDQTDGPGSTAGQMGAFMTAAIGDACGYKKSIWVPVGFPALSVLHLLTVPQ